MIYESNGWFFADEVYRTFGQNLFVPGVGLVTVLPANDYVRQHGRNLTTLAMDGYADSVAERVDQSKWLANSHT